LLASAAAADYAMMAGHFKPQSERALLGVRRDSGQAESKMMDFENRSGAYFQVREHRKRRKPPFADRPHLNTGTPQRSPEIYLQGTDRRRHS
jgi:hypothetical protein